MARWYEFAVVQLATHAMRDEKLNIGLVIMGETIDVRPGRNLDKVKAISHAISAASIKESLKALCDLDLALRHASETNSDRLRRVSNLTGLEFSAIGKFEAASSAAYEDYVAELVTKLVEPEPTFRKRLMPNTKLTATLRSELRSRRILARDGEGLSSHRIVANWKVDEGLVADFALQNGLLHVIKTVDAQSDTISFKKVVQDIAVSALVLETARVSYGADKIRGRIIYSANSYNESLAFPSLETAAHQGAELINWSSAEDRKNLVDTLSDLAAPLPLLDEIQFKSINASVREISKLN
ncbi:hypothetical protein NF699_07040 [Sphingomonadaceae bacterium OTU29LAMAA1]|nr:hypothetical protein NF699_07040 [Sphingomonadaceae bacterium OTU29LAMAA1]